MQLILYTPVGAKLKTGEIKARMEPSPLGLFVMLSDWNQRELLYEKAVVEFRNTIKAQEEVIAAYKKVLEPKPIENGTQ